MSEEIPIKILVPEEEATTIPVVEERPLVPEVPGGRSGFRSRAGARARQAAKKTGQGAGKAARRIWRSEARRKITRGVGKGATAVAAKGTQVIDRQVRKTAERQAQAVQTRLRETDWKAEAKTGAAKGLRWLSQQFSSLAARLTSQKNPPPNSPE